MALYDTTWYVNAGDQSTTGHYAVAKRPQNTAVVAGQLCRQFTAPAVGSERVFICHIAGTTANVTDATWSITRGGKTIDGTVQWTECTGMSAVNGDLANTPSWSQVKAIGGSPNVGVIIKRNNGASYQICTGSAALGASEPAFSDVAGVTTVEGSLTWTSLGPVGNFTGGQAPHARLANACATNWFAAGNTIYVASNHAETLSSALNPAPATSPSTMGRVICHNGGSYPPAAGNIATGASISTVTATSMTFTAAGGFYFYGLTFRVGVGQSSGCNFTFSISGAWVYADACSFEIATTSSSGAALTIGSGSYGSLTFNNTTVKFGNAAQKIVPQNCQFIWQNTGQVLVSGSAVPAQLLVPATVAGPMVLEALDLSQLSGSLCTTTTIVTNLLIKDCKLHASATIDTPTAPGITLQTVRCDSGATGYKSSRYAYEGTESTETSITRVGGATDPASQAQSRKIVTTANAQWLRPFKAEPYAIWNATTGANVTATVCGTINSGTLPNNDEIWLEVEYLSSSGSPLGAIVTTTKANVLATSAAVSADGSTWATATTYDGTVPANISVSNGGLTLTHVTTTADRIFSQSAYSTGKLYFESTIVTRTTNGHSLGATPVGTSVGSTAQGGVGVNISTASTIVYSNGTTTGKALGVIANGDVISSAIDLTAGLAWFRRNGGNWNGDVSADPATGVGGVTVPAGTHAPYVYFTTLGSSDVITSNFGQSAFAYAVPSGFTNWNLWTAFKLTTTLNAPQPGMAGYIHARVRAAKPSTTYYIDPKVTLT